MAKIADEIKSFFLGDTSGLERAVGTATRVLDTYGKKEQQVALAAKRAFDTCAGNIKNTLVNPTGAAVDGLSKVVASMKMSAVTTGVLGAGISLAADKFFELRSEAIAARKETDQFNESYRKSFQANIHQSSAQDSGSLMGKLADLREAEVTLKQKSFDLNVSDTSAAGIMLRARYNAESPIFADENLQRDRDQVKMQLQGNSQQQTGIQKDIGGSLTRQGKLVTNRLQGSSAQGQIMELRAARRREIDALKDSTASSPANFKLIEDRYAKEIGAVRELVKLEGDRFQLAGRLRGIEISSRTDAQKRLDSAQASLKEKQNELLTSRYNNKEATDALQSEITQQNALVTQAKAELAVEQSRTTLARQVTTIEGTNLSRNAKQYSTTLATNTALHDQYNVMVKINGTAAEGLRQQIAGNDEAVRLMRQEAMYGKSNATIQKEIQRNRENKINRDKFDARMDRDDGLVDIHRGLDGSIIDGLDPITGQRRAPRPGKGRVEHGLSGGNGGAVHDTDAGGGLHTGGLTSGSGGGMMFGGADLFQERHNALVKAGLVSSASVADKLANPEKYGFGDPVATMNRAPTFVDLNARLADEFKGAYRIKGPSTSLAAANAHWAAISAGYGTELVKQMRERASQGMTPGFLDSNRANGAAASSGANALLRVQSDSLKVRARPPKLSAKCCNGLMGWPAIGASPRPSGPRPGLDRGGWLAVPVWNILIRSNST